MCPTFLQLSFKRFKQLSHLIWYLSISSFHTLPHAHFKFKSVNPLMQLYNLFCLIFKKYIFKKYFQDSKQFNLKLRIFPVIYVASCCYSSRTIGIKKHLPPQLSSLCLVLEKIHSRPPAYWLGENWRPFRVPIFAPLKR